MTNHCGSCTACCRIFDIPELAKPAGRWCQHCEIGRGCQIYAERPDVCATFECYWLKSQQRENPAERWSAALRPDKCKVVLAGTTNENIISATTMPGAPLAWDKPAMRAVIKILVSGGLSVVIGAPLSTRRTMVDRSGQREVRLTEPDAQGMQWHIEEQQP